MKFVLNSWKFFLIGAFLTLAFLYLKEILSVPIASIQNLIFDDSFEDGDLSQWRTTDGCCDHSFKIVTDQARTGSHSLKFTLFKSDPNVHSSKRSEIDKPGDVFHPVGSERWYGFSIYLPDDWVADEVFEILAQFQSLPDLELGEEFRTPPLSLLVNRENWSVRQNWDSRKVFQGKPQGSEKLWTGPIQRGQWTDWVFHLKWSYKNDGLIQVWKDGQMIVNKNGANAYNDPFIYLKIGIYKPEWNSSKDRSLIDERIAYYDTVKIGDENTNPQIFLTQ